MTVKRAVLYLRVSTGEQSCDNQELALRSMCEQRGYQIIAVYSESESAWKAGHQKELARLVGDAHKGKFDTVLCWSLDRLSREGALAILSLVHRLRLYGVKVISFQESWTEAPGELGDLLLALTGWVARMESQRRSERTKAGMARARRDGKSIGRPKGSKDKRRRKKGSPRVHIWPDTFTLTT